MSGVTKIMLSNYADFRNAEWEDFTSSSNTWSIGTAKGLKTVHLKVRDYCGNVTQKSAQAFFVGTIVGNIIVYPNPWRPGSGGEYDDTAVTFDGLPLDAKLQIFDISGNLVYEHTNDTGGKITWEGKNASGKKVASGIYIWLATDKDGNTKVGKLGVIR